MKSDPASDMLAQALEAYDAGLCVIRAATDGTKKPLGAWLQYQAQRPSRAQVTGWFMNGHPAMGAVCGAVSNDLEMFELEGRFVKEVTTGAFAKAMMAAGLGDLLKRLRAGIIAVSPSGGRHFLYHVDGPVDGNTKLAQRDATDDELAENPDDRYKTLIETRGEGGFVMLAPSHGPAHPSGTAWKISEGGYSTIPTITVAERAALFDVARSFHTASSAPTPPPKPSGKPLTVTKADRAPGDSWFDATVDHLRSTIDMRTLLEHYGWQHIYTDRRGRDMLKRPGKDTDGISGSINDSGRLLVFSTSTGFTAYSGPNTPTPTYDQLDVIAYYDHGNDRQAAARAVAERAGIFDARDKAKRDEMVAFIPAGDRPADIAETGEVAAPIDDELWTERPLFEHIFQAARSRLVSPYAVLGCILARVAAFTPPTTCLPPLIGGTAPLSFYIALHGASGDGKSSPIECAASLLPNIPPGCKGPLGLGSGEGLIEAFLERVEIKDENNKTKRVQRQAFRGVLFSIDEGQVLGEIAGRKGATIMPILRTAWSGSELGQANAGEETKRTLSAKGYNLGIISAWQDDAGALLLADVVGGTPQRFVWMPTADRGVERKRIPWPGPLDWEPPNFNRIGDTLFHEPLRLPEEVQERILNDRWDVLERVVTLNPLDSHRNLNKLRISGLLAVLDGRRDVTLDDWRLSERLMCISDAVRDGLLERTKEQAVERVRTEAVRYAMRDAVVEQSARDRALNRAARAAWRACAASDEPASRRAITQRIAGRDREHVTVDEAIAEAIRLRLIVGNEASGWRPGEVKPA